jgi:hypothetical protein
VDDSDWKIVSRRRWPPTTTIRSPSPASVGRPKWVYSWLGTRICRRTGCTALRYAFPIRAGRLPGSNASTSRPNWEKVPPFNINRVIIQRQNTRMMVYYWFQHGDRRIAWDFAQKLHLLVDSVRTGHVHGGIVRLTTLISANETEADAEARLQDMLAQMGGALPRFFPTY